jgi:hypothetical protein
MIHHNEDKSTLVAPELPVVNAPVVVKEKEEVMSTFDGDFGEHPGLAAQTPFTILPSSCTIERG